MITVNRANEDIFCNSEPDLILPAIPKISNCYGKKMYRMYKSKNKMIRMIGKSGK